MMTRNTFVVLALSVTVLGGALTANGQTADPADQMPDLPALPAPEAIPSAVPPLADVPPGLPEVPADAGVPGLPPIAPGVTTLSQAPGLPALPGMPGTTPDFGAIPGAATTAADSVPMPPPLGSMTFESTDESVDDTTASVANAAAPSQLYEFLFIEDPDYGVVRQQFESEVAQNLKNQEIERLLTTRRAGQQPGAGLNIPGVTPGYDPAFGGDPSLGGFGPQAGLGGVANPALGNESATRAAAEWDFYYEQLEMYDVYIREKLIPEAEDLPVLEYTAANALQERQDLFESYQEAAIEESNKDYNANKDFYERLQKREDRRRAYIDWTRLKEREVSEWSEVWARQVFGTRWADGEVVKVDDWYYGTDFNSAQPVLVEIDDREYIISRQPLRSLQDGQLNVISSNLTPYDIIDTNGYLKNPVMETLRGTLIIPPAPPVYATEATTGTIEIIGGE